MSGRPGPGELAVGTSPSPREVRELKYHHRQTHKAKLLSPSELWHIWLQRRTCRISPPSIPYSIRHRKLTFSKISDGTLPIFGFILESHNYSLAVSPTSMHSLWKGRRIILVKKGIPAEVERSKKKRQENHFFFKFWKSSILDLPLQLESWK